MWTKAYLSLGSNLGDRARNIDEALERLSGGGITVVRRSSLYETEPRDFLAQPWFLNMVAEIRTDLCAEALLTRVAAVEAELGRQRSIEKGPRTIDIDILTFGDTVIQTSVLEIPHPRIAERRFVLEPLAELEPDLNLAQGTVTDLLHNVNLQTVRRILKV